MKPVQGPLDLCITGIDDVEMLAGTPFTKLISISDAELQPIRSYESQLRAFFPTAQPHFSYFDDVEYPKREGPNRDAVARILLFSRSFTPQDKILLQCRAGISRSAAIACAVAVQHSPPGHEKKAVQYVRSIRPQMLPNFLVIQLADALLERGGKLIAAVAQARGPH